MSSTPLVSIVTPSFNQGHFLEETILSVLKQDYPRIEYMVIDGGSNDGSVDIIRKYESSLAYWVSEKDNGQTHAISKGWKRCGGEIIAWINSDDTYVIPNAISEVVKGFQQNPEWAMLYGDSWYIDEHSNIIKEREGYINKRTAIPFDINSLLISNQVPQPATFLKREAVIEVGGLDETLYNVMDFDLWCKIGLRYPVGNLHNIYLCNFRFHKDSKFEHLDERYIKENELVIMRTTSDKHFPYNPKKSRARALSTLYFGQATRLISDSHQSQARYWLYRSVKTYPMIIFLPGIRFFRICFWVLLGTIGTAYGIKFKRYLKSYL
jgi:glycosyltransferase involved in cell wall biosynthesis